MMNTQRYIFMRKKVTVCELYNLISTYFKIKKIIFKQNDSNLQCLRKIGCLCICSINNQ